MPGTCYHVSRHDSGASWASVNEKNFLVFKHVCAALSSTVGPDGYLDSTLGVWLLLGMSSSPLHSYGSVFQGCFRMTCAPVALFLLVSIIGL